MYLKLGKTNIKYSTGQDDYMIFAEILDSGLSYHKPVLVRTSDELDIWFGREFSDYDYLKELLGLGVTLFLYKPVSPEQDSRISEYIDYSNYQESDRIYWSTTDFPKTGESGVLYKLGTSITESGEEVVEHYIWLPELSEYAEVSKLPQNLDLLGTSSGNNRDTLRVSGTSGSGPQYTYPRYTDIQDGFSQYLLPEIDTEMLLENLPDPEKIDLGYETLVFDVVFPKIQPSTPSPYIILDRVKSGKRDKVMVFFDSGDGIPSTIGQDYYSEAIPISVGTKSREVLAIEFKKLLVDRFGYNIIDSGLEPYKFQLQSSYSLPVNYFWTIPDLEMNPNFQVTSDILAELTKDSGRIEFFSKTIGTVVDSEGQIQVDIKDIGNSQYRITISRYDYSETFEGTLSGPERLDYVITKESKLVESRITATPDTKLPGGTWKLRRATQEKVTPDMYWKAIDSVFNDGDTVFFDLLLIPEMANYTPGLVPEYDYYPEFPKFLDYAKLIGCQVLIQNSDNPWKYETLDTIPTEPKPGIVYIITQEGVTKFMILQDGVLVETVDREITNTRGNNFVFNYTEDIENRLVYFFRDMTVSGNPRPAYYLHILGLLGDIYSMSSKYILYNSPVTNPYQDEESEELLELKKSNYLVSNNQLYYYKKYQNGDSYTTTSWMRFILGKVARELEKGKWDILGHRTVGEIESEIMKILKRIQSRFSLVLQIGIKDFTVDFVNSKISLTVSTSMSDLVDNNIDLDITLNYNK